jgi:cobaltochelatase CobT
VASEKESPGNEFKRVLAVAMKTIAEDPELSVAFGNESPSLSGNKAKLPQIGDDLKASDIAIVRQLMQAHEYGRMKQLAVDPW